MRRQFAFAASFLALAGCTVGPDYHAPKVDVPARYVEQQPSGATVDPAHWWTAFGDPELTSLIERALAGNPDIAIAASRVRQARLQEIEARAIGLPTVDAQAGATNIHLSKNAGFSELARAFGGGSSDNSGSAGGITLPGSSITTYAAGFDASWELDLFGRGTRTRQAARASTEAAVWNQRDAAVTLAAEVADAYFAYRLDQAQIAILKNEIANLERADQISAHIAQTGLQPPIDVVRQRASLTQTRARLQPLEADAKIRIHALGTLLGKGPDALSAELADSKAELGPAPEIPAGLPSDLLRRRPDVRAAERNLAAATAQVGVAVADLYPRFSLTGLAQLISTSLGSLFQGDSVQTTASASAMFPILDWGKRKATVASRKEDDQQAYLAYQKTVLRALKDVEDALAQISAERARNAQLRSALSDAERTESAVAAQYKTGFVAQDSLINAQVSALSARESLAASNAKLRQDTAALFKAMGGGWSEKGPASDAETKVDTQAPIDAQ
ncbi:efflux transporter outer membrane subunit [Porphyrobacter algicida]|uniref:Efflux transporter outer membrane subunit n=1 Tax=Qipengyuania algicida TaxID=1836209 RepID=A0A845ABY3_9SPHN|nr:efflux transporter outer membrane subunit [Qipengyuania algicida]MXP27750.1 efflux transporter outer membrane subunit [Qipengyuania algicida]